MAVGDVYEVTDVQDYLGQEILNVYFYQQQAAFAPLSGTTAQALADEFETTVVPVIAGPQHVSLVHREVRVRNLFNATDAGLAVSGFAGLVTGGGDAMPAFNAYGFKLSHDNAAVRPGSKRIAGAFEGAHAGGVMSGSSLTLLDAIEVELAQPITGGLIIEDDIMFPIIVQRVREGAPGSYTYRLPENSGELTFGLILEALVNLVLTSQVSRKVGVGI